MVDTEKTAAIILAAGLSSRMGRFKPLLSLGRETVIEAAIGNFITAGLKQVLVVTGYRSEDLVPVLKAHPVQWVFNNDYRKEMFSSVKTGVGHLEAGIHGFFLLPVDIPFVRMQTVMALCGAFDPHKMDILRPCFQGKRGHPPIISASAIPHIQNFKDSGGMKALIYQRKLRTKDLECPDPGILTDMDSIKDYESARKNWVSEKN
jgi:CTP:molybdopterin cytidylyltransferase MocA